MRSRSACLVLSSITLLIFLLAACTKLMPPAPAENELLDGPLTGLNAAQSAQFLAGDIAFNDEVFTVQSGLGPLFVSNSCGSCHAGDGKGHPFTTLTRFGQKDTLGNQFLHLGGPQLQNRAIPGYLPEEIPAGATRSSFTPPANTGLGFIELVPDTEILALADPYDGDLDGISGRPNWNHIPAWVNPGPGSNPHNGRYICRFGKKGATYDLLQQTANAYNQDMGINSVFNPTDVYSGLNVSPEVTETTIRNVVAYLQMLKAPLARDENDATVLKGKDIFMTIGCHKCHTPALHTGYSNIEPLSFKTFFPYTDLLLHDMGAALDDGYTEGCAETFEWRTPPLWGLGLSKASQGGKYYLMHDGRAGSIEQAIEMHGGEATASKLFHQSLSDADKKALVKFLESL